MQASISLARFCAQAAGSMPVIALLSLLAGRRGNGSFCLYGAGWLLGLALILAMAGPVWLACSYLAEVLPYQLAWPELLGPLLKPAGLPWTLALLAWLCGWILLLPARQNIGLFGRQSRSDCYSAGQIKIPISLLLASACLFFASFVFLNWPFAGLPDSISPERAFMAIFRHANSEYFRGFSAAAAISLALWPVWSKRIPGAQMPVAARWLAFWAFAGNLPWLLSSLGPALGASFNASHMAGVYGVHRQLAVLALQAAAAICWALLLWRPQLLAACAWTGSALLLIANLLPPLLF